METRSKEELYQEYRTQMLRTEEDKEAYQRKVRRFEQEKEESREICKEEKRSVDHLTEMWGECEDIGRLRCEMGDFMDEEQKNLERQEAELAEEYQNICRQERCYEDQYREACRKLDEGGESV